MTLFEAITILKFINNLPYFRINIIGGDKDDVESLKSIIIKLPYVNSMYYNGQISVWGHVEPSGLAELYSRSLVTIVPSLFEQFGLVAPEAMACGCPVLASDIGGLKDSVIPCVTGKLFNAGDSLHLAALLAGYLRGPHIAVFEGGNAVIWAKNKFSINEIYSNLDKVIKDEEIISDKQITPRKEFNTILLNTLTSDIEKELGQRIIGHEDFSGNSHISFNIKTTRKQYYIKYFHDRPSASCLYLYCPDDILKASRRVSNIKKAHVLSAAPFSTQLININEKKGFIIYEWVEHSNDHSTKDLKSFIPTILSIQHFGEKITKSYCSELFFEGLQAIEIYPNLEGLNSFYKSAAAINSLLDGEFPTYLDSHPQVELLNIKLAIENNLYPLPQNEKTRLILLTNLVLSSFPLITTKPVLSHGDIKPEHLLVTKKTVKLCDWETTGFRCGPYDIASWFFKNEIGQKIGNVQESMEKAKEWLVTDEDKILFLCWFASMACHEFLTRYLRGQFYDKLRHGVIFNSLPEAIVKLSKQFTFGKTVIQ